MQDAMLGNPEAFGALVKNFESELRRFACRWVPDSNDVHDIVQETFIEAYRHLERFDSHRDFRPWIRAICLNRIRHFFRGRRRRRTAALADVDAAIESRMVASAQTNLAADLAIDTLRDCIERLGLEHRRFVEWRYGRNLKLVDMARIVKRSVASVSRMLAGVHTLLARCVQKNQE